MVDLGNAISNIISTGDGESDMYLTFTFSMNAPALLDGSPEATEKLKAMEGIAKGAVNSTIEHIRDAVVAGKY